MKTILFGFVLFAMFLTLVPVYAASSCGGVETKPNAVYINGVWNDRVSAGKNRDDIEAYLANQGLRSRFGKVILAFNKSHGSSQDLYDVLVQKERESPSVWYGVVNMMTRYAVIGPSVLIETATLQDTTLGSVVAFLSGKISDSLTLKDYVDDDFVQVSADIAVLGGDANLLIIPHSQGTLYAGRVYQQYTKTGRKVSIAAIANAALSLPAGEYVTSHNDGVISWLSALYKTAPSNTAISRNTGGSMGHTLAFDYLGMAAGQAAIAAMIDRQLAYVPAISVEGTGSGIPVTLSWPNSLPVTLWISDSVGMHSAVGVGGTATVDLCSPTPFTFYFVWISSTGDWPLTARISAGTTSKDITLPGGNSIQLEGDNVPRRLAGGVYIDPSGVPTVY